MENSTSKRWEPIDFTVYLKFALPWALLVVAIEIIFTIVSNRAGSGFIFDFQQYIIWAIRIIVFGFIGWRKNLAFGINNVIACISGIMVGGIAGFLISIFMLLEGFKVWKIFNIFSETVFLAILCAALFLLVSLILKPKNNNQ